jgi:hypothetical protein
VAEGARLESVFTRKGNVGSNPTLSASFKIASKHADSVSLLLFCPAKSGDTIVFLCNSHDVKWYADPPWVARFSFYCIYKYAIISGAERVRHQVKYFSIKLDLIVLCIT